MCHSDEHWTSFSDVHSWSQLVSLPGNHFLEFWFFCSSGYESSTITTLSKSNSFYSNRWSNGISSFRFNVQVLINKIRSCRFRARRSGFSRVLFRGGWFSGDNTGGSDCTGRAYQTSIRLSEDPLWFVLIRWNIHFTSAKTLKTVIFHHLNSLITNRYRSNLWFKL